MQKTADEMRISDMSSDVCSSDLPLHQGGPVRRPKSASADGSGRPAHGHNDPVANDSPRTVRRMTGPQRRAPPLDVARRLFAQKGFEHSSEESRGGKECVRKCRSGRRPYNGQKQKRKKIEN